TDAFTPTARAGPSGPVAVSSSEHRAVAITSSETIVVGVAIRPVNCYPRARVQCGHRVTKNPQSHRGCRVRPPHLCAHLGHLGLLLGRKRCRPTWRRDNGHARDARAGYLVMSQSSSASSATGT